MSYVDLLGYIKEFGGATLYTTCMKGIEVGMALPDILKIVIPHTIDFAVTELESEIAKRINGGQS